MATTTEGIYFVFVVISRGVWANIGIVKACVFEGNGTNGEVLKECPRYKVSPDNEPHGKASRKIKILAFRHCYHTTQSYFEK